MKKYGLALLAVLSVAVLSFVAVLYVTSYKEVVAAPTTGGLASPTRGLLPDHSWAKNRNVGLKGLKAYNYGDIEFDEKKSAEEWDKDLKELMKGEKESEVVLGASVAYYLDVLFGDASKNDDPGAVINDSIYGYVTNKHSYEQAMEKVSERLEKAKSIKVERRVVKDQAYQDHFNLLQDCLKLGVEMPTVIIMEPIVEETWTLVYTFDVGGRDKELVLAIPSGFAPANWSKITLVKPGNWEIQPQVK